MNKQPIDLIGKKFGMLTVVEYAGKNSYGHKSFNQWKCECECGNFRIMSTGEINRNRTPISSCGCYRPKRDISGLKFGYLTAIKISHKKKTHYHWFCKCDCGNELTVEENALVRKKTKSCGCLVRLKHEYLISKSRERLISRTKIVGECWEWQGGKDKGGYGLCGVAYPDKRSHRASYIAFKGEIPKGLYICHHCDNPSCIRPDHLYAGTAKENMKDAMERGLLQKGPYPSKGQQGEKNPKSKLNEIKVKEIRNLYKNPYTSKQLSQIYGVCESQIKRIYRKEVWKCIS